MLEQATVRVRRLVAIVVAVVATATFGGFVLSPAAVAQATVAEGEACPVSGNTAVSSTSGQALICTPLQDNGPAGDLRWRVQTAANTPLDPAVTTTVAGDTTTTTSATVPASTTAPPTTAAAMPTTGVDSGRWAGEAAILVIIGAVLVTAGRRRRRRGFGVPA